MRSPLHWAFWESTASGLNLRRATRLFARHSIKLLCGYLVPLLIVISIIAWFFDHSLLSLSEAMAMLHDKQTTTMAQWYAFGTSIAIRSGRRFPDDYRELSSRISASPIQQSRSCSAARRRIIVSHRMELPPGSNRLPIVALQLRGGLYQSRHPSQQRRRPRRLGLVGPCHFGGDCRAGFWRFRTPAMIRD